MCQAWVWLQASVPKDQYLLLRALDEALVSLTGLREGPARIAGLQQQVSPFSCWHSFIQQVPCSTAATQAGQLPLLLAYSSGPPASTGSMPCCMGTRCLILQPWPHVSHDA